jgi:hypothetical protein
MTGQRIGRVHDVNVTTFEGARKYKGKAIAISNTVYDFFGGNFLFTQCVREDSPTNNSCAVVGGTGRFAERVAPPSRTSPTESRTRRPGRSSDPSP